MLSQERILIVDDNTAARRHVKKMLAPYSYLIEEASDGWEGLKKASLFRPDLILLDIIMPRMDGLKMCRLLHQNIRTRDIPIIILTSMKKSTDTLKCLQMGANDFINKPFLEQDLLARVQRQLEIKEKLDVLMSEKEDLSLIQKMVHTLYEKKSMYDLLYTLVTKISEVIHVERCSFVRLRDDRKTGVVEASSDGPNIRNLEIDLKKYPEILEVLDTKEMMILQHIGKAPIMASVREHLKDIKFQSLVLIPVIADDRLLGTLLLRSARSKKTFTKREIRFLEAIACASKPAIINAQLFEQMEERIIQAPVVNKPVEDSSIRYEISPQENGKDTMDRFLRIKDDVQRLKSLRKKEQKQKKDEPEDDEK